MAGEALSGTEGVRHALLEVLVCRVRLMRRLVCRTVSLCLPLSGRAGRLSRQADYHREQTNYIR
jgi:hypothetical protein